MLILISNVHYLYLCIIFFVLPQLVTKSVINNLNQYSKSSDSTSNLCIVLPIQSSLDYAVKYILSQGRLFLLRS